MNIFFRIYLFSVIVLAFTFNSDDRPEQPHISSTTSSSLYLQSGASINAQSTSTTTYPILRIDSTIPTATRNLNPDFETQNLRSFMHYGPTPFPNISYTFSDNSQRDKSTVENHATHHEIETFIRNLRIFVCDYVFDFCGFEYHIEEYRNDYADLEFMIENGSDYTKEDMSKLEIAGDMFSDMVSATERLKRYSRSNYPAHVLVAKMIELYIVAKSLYSSSGHVDSSVYRYTERILDFKTLFQKLTEEYTGIISNPTNTKSQIFNVYAARTAGIIDGLSREAERSNM